MPHYEVLFVVHPDQSEQVPALVEKYKDLLTADGGSIHREEDWGRRKLAYPINKVHKGHFVLLNAECGSAAVDELVEGFRFNDAILRHMVMRKDYAPTEPSPIAKETKQKEKGSSGDGEGEGSSRKPEPAPSEVEPTEADAGEEATPEGDGEEEGNPGEEVFGEASPEEPQGAGESS